MSFPITRFSLFPSYQLSSFPIYSFAPRHPARFLFYLTDFFSPALPLRILFCKGNAGDCSNTKSSIALTEKSSSASRVYFPLPIWLIDRHHSWKAKNIPWAGRKSLRKKGRKKHQSNGTQEWLSNPKAVRQASDLVLQILSNSFLGQ